MERRELDFVVLNQGYVSVNGRELEHEASGNALLTELYRNHIADWPKFFKMDTLSKAGFVASELLIKELGEHRLGSEEFAQGRAIVLFGATASLCADRNYQETIQDKDNYYPSPALFVYTLPNIVTGEIAIRNHWRGETSFYVTEAPDAAQMAFHLACAFQDQVTDSILAGWVDSSRNDDFQAFMTVVRREDAADTGWIEGQLKRMINILNNK
jgi:3-oxoacyl-[acyl-carrier-protein] synthase-1